MSFLWKYEISYISIFLLWLNMSGQALKPEEKMRKSDLHDPLYFASFYGRKVDENNT